MATRTEPHILYDTKYWRDRAEQARAMASQMTTPQARTTMLQIAEGYETMARHAEVRRAKAEESN